MKIYEINTNRTSRKCVVIANSYALAERKAIAALRKNFDDIYGLINIESIRLLDYEILGDIDDVVFPTGTAIFDGRLYIYYGAADKVIAVASVNLNKLLHELLASEVEAGIGFLAGKIYKLAFNEEKTLTQIKKRLNQEESVILMAIGWLTRENKILCRYDDGELVVRTLD